MIATNKITKCINIAVIGFVDYGKSSSVWSYCFQGTNCRATLDSNPSKFGVVRGNKKELSQEKS